MTDTEHKDKLGRLLKVGDFVAYPSQNSLQIGIVKKLNRPTAQVAPVGTGFPLLGHHKYPGDLVLLDGPEVTLYLLKMVKNS